MKIVLDKYFTPVSIANHCYDVVIDLIGEDNIDEIVEPSVGNGSFLHHSIVNRKPMLCIDIDSGVDNVNGIDIIRADWLEYPIDYRSNRLVIGNPPYGSRMNLAQKFFKKSVVICDYIAFILPISQLGNVQSLYEFDLIHSEDLGELSYSGVKLRCCFNVYRRPLSGKLNSKASSKLSYVSICRNDSKRYNDFVYDIRMCAWGDGSAGKILSDGESYSAEYKIKIDDSCPFRDDVIDYLCNFDWCGYLSCIAMRKIQQFHIIDIIREKFGE